MPHAEATTWEGLSADLAAAVAWLRSDAGPSAERVFVVGFCFGGRLAFVAATLGLDLAGVIGFYGKTVGPGAAAFRRRSTSRSGSPRPSWDSSAGTTRASRPATLRRSRRRSKRPAWSTGS